MDCQIMFVIILIKPLDYHKESNKYFTSFLWQQNTVNYNYQWLGQR